MHNPSHVRSEWRSRLDACRKYSDIHLGEDGPDIIDPPEEKPRRKDRPPTLPPQPPPGTPRRKKADTQNRRMEQHQ